MSYALNSRHGGGKFQVANFPDAMPALADPRAQVSLARRSAPRSGAPELVVDVPLQPGRPSSERRRFEGTRTQPGASIGGAAAASEWVVFRVDEQARVITAVPVDEGWVQFRPQLRHTTLTTDEAEQVMKSKTKAAELQKVKLQSLRREEEGPGDARKGDGRVRGGGTGGSGDDSDEFEDGAEPEWNQEEERGAADDREGLDMDEDELFDDDDDDQAADDDKKAVEERAYVKRSAAEAALPSHLRQAQASDIFEGEADEGAGAVARQRADLREWRRQQRTNGSEASSDEDEFEDDDEDDERPDWAQALRQGSPSGAKAEVKTEGAAKGAGAKRGLSPGGSSSSPGGEGRPEGKRSKPAPTAAQLEAQLGLGRQAVSEEDVVLLIHKHGRIPLAKLLEAFKPRMATKEDRTAFHTIVQAVALCDADREACLKDSALRKYNLPDPKL